MQGLVALHWLPHAAEHRGMTPRRTHVLLLERAGGAADRAVDALTAAGHVVSRCAAAGAPSGVCNALAAGQPCPLDATIVDVVVEVRAPGHPQHGVFEGGGACAHRNGVPLVVVSSLEDVVAACDQALKFKTARGQSRT